jgi:hypothetical protein
VSMRTQIHSAFDELAPATLGLPERVVQTVLTENHSRRRRERLMLRLRVPLSLVAVFVLIAVVVGVLIGGRLSAANPFHDSAPAGDSYQSQVAQLEAVPLRIPVVQSPLDCRTGPYNSAGSFGSGPVYGEGGAFPSSDGALYYHSGLYYNYYNNDAYAETKVAGPILVRALDLYTRQPVIFVGQYAAGPAALSDTIDGRTYDQRPELLLNTSNSDKRARSHEFVWPFVAGVPTTWSGSTGWQIDGIGFSEVFVVC